ncbi:leucine-rich repeat domain-containing protein [Lutispora thermophila]|uniref:Leucine-rich repeat (LRR) protein n=1 Tax=Lutispora thermophila DSM 19022 TaxID=1122184 RepID=A0A1M6I844_9FIRM|nr:leucine-rich repeat domain-containing protein [Lutispora thermophila]SHJ30595.1 Leucine-rich repeat (LRR) protein [Lutispora thermophila DSM 19022]
MKFLKMSLLILICTLFIIGCNSNPYKNAHNASTTDDGNELLYGKYPEPVLMAIESYDINKYYKEITKNDLRKVTYLYFKDGAFEDGKEYDFSILLETPNLRYLNINFDGNIKLEDYSVLKNLKKLEVLYISNVTNDDVKNLAGLTSLEQLNVYNSKDLTSGEFLSNMQQLTDLSFHNVPNFHDYQPLKKLSKLNDLLVCNVNNEDVKDIAGITSLKELDIHDSKDLTSIEFLRDMQQLIYLGLENVPNVHDYKPLKHLINVKQINLTSSGLTEKDINTFPDMDSIESLSLYDNEITSLNVFPKMKNLESLTLGNNPLTEVNILPDRIPKLKDLDLYNTKITDLNKLSGVSNIETINLRKTFIKRISPLKKYKNLKFINIDLNNLEDMDVFKDSPVEIGELEG